MVQTGTLDHVYPYTGKTYISKLCRVLGKQWLVGPILGIQVLHHNK